MIDVATLCVGLDVQEDSIAIATRPRKPGSHVLTQGNGLASAADEE